MQKIKNLFRFPKLAESDFNKQLFTLRKKAALTTKLNFCDEKREQNIHFGDQNFVPP